MNILDIQHLSKKYSNTQLALDALNLRVSRGSIFGFLGPNGAGKSTTINIIAGLVRKTSGRVSFSGEEITDRSFEYKRMIGFVLERPTFFEKLTGKEYLEFAGSMYDIEKQDAQTRSDELLEYFDLSEKRNMLIEGYSNGMKKKISLAAALIHHPQLLILDEPLEGMDPVSAVRTKEVLLDLKSRGTSILIASHQLDSMEILCDEVAIVDHGKNVFQTTMAGMRDSFKNEVTRERYRSLEELFIDVIAGDNKNKSLPRISWPTP